VNEHHKWLTASNGNTMSSHQHGIFMESLLSDLK